MCILLSSTEHPEYPFVLLSNRDEYYQRPTETAHLRSYDGFDIVSPLDLGRPEHGTWIGVSSKGKIAVLVNYREDDESGKYSFPIFVPNLNTNTTGIVSEVSRGILPIDYLMSQKTEEEWLENIEVSLAERTPQLGVKEVSLRRIGGFSLLYGHLRLSSSKEIEPLHILSNRGDRGVVHARGSDVAGSELRFTNREQISSQTTFGLSNSLYYNPWKKVELGRKLLLRAVERSVAEGSDMEYFVEQCFEVLSHNTYSEEVRQGNDSAKKFQELQNSIFIPAIETGESSDAKRSSRTIGKYYGTRTQTVILLRRDGKLFYCERNLHNSDDLLDTPVTTRYTFDLQQQLGSYNGMKVRL